MISCHNQHKQFCLKESVVQLIGKNENSKELVIFSFQVRMAELHISYISEIRLSRQKYIHLQHTQNLVEPVISLILSVKNQDF